MSWSLLLDLWGVFLLFVAFTALFALIVAGWLVLLHWLIREYMISRTLKQERKAIEQKEKDLFVRVEKFRDDFE